MYSYTFLVHIVGWDTKETTSFCGQNLGRELDMYGFALGNEICIP